MRREASALPPPGWLPLAATPVAVNYAKDTDAADNVVADIRNGGGAAVAVQADVSVEADVMRLFATAEHEFGTVAALVNNAGITGGFARVADISAGALERVFAVNEPLPTCRTGRSRRVQRFPAVAPMGTSGRRAEAKVVVRGLHPGLAVMLTRFLRRLQREDGPMHYRLVTTSVVERLWIMLSATRSTRSTADLHDRGREPTP